MSQQGQAQNLQQEGVRLFEEARSGLSDALGRMTEAATKLASGELTPEARAVWREKFDRAFVDSEELKTRASALNTATRTFTDLNTAARAPRYQRPMDDGASGGDALGSGAGGEVPGDEGGGGAEVPTRLGRAHMLPEDAWTERDPRNRIQLAGKARYLINKLMRGAERGGGWANLSREETTYLKAPRVEQLMSPFIDRDGGSITAEEVRNEVIRKVRDVVYIRSRARVIATTAAEVTFPSARIDVKLQKTRPGKGNGDVGPLRLRDIFGKLKFVPSGKSKIIAIPEELLDDQTFDVVGFISEEIARNDIEDEELSFIMGSGSGEPLGLVPALQKLDAAGFTGLRFPHSGSGAVDFTPNDLKQFPYRLKKKYRTGGVAQGAAWTVNREFLLRATVMRTEVGGANTGQYLFQQGISPGDPDNIVGYTVLESEFVPDFFTTGSTGDPMVIFGNWLYYWIVDRKSLDVRVLPEIYTETDEVGYKYVKRYDGAPVRPDAFVYMSRH